VRCISQYSNHMIQIRHQQQQGMGDGSIRITVEPIYAKWDPEAMIYEQEVERANRTFSFHGRTQHIDEATPTEIVSRLSLFDTEAQGYDEKTRLFVEEELRKYAIQTPQAFFIAEETPLPAPYPTWDTSQKPGFELVTGLVDMGFDLNAALAYERTFGPQRDTVIEALEAVIADRQQDVITA